MIDPKSVAFGEDMPPIDDRDPDGFVPLSVPSYDLMSIESIDIQLDITGSANALDALRLILVAPDGTQSELNPVYGLPGDQGKNFQVLPGNLLVDPPGTLTGDAGDHFQYTFSTNRDWGERSDSGDGVFKLYFENYSKTGLSLNGVRASFHGNPIGSPTTFVQRVQGVVGVDSGFFGFGVNDGDFNFQRYVTDPMTGIRFADFTQEQFGSNVTVYAVDKATNQVVSQFVTGADGNYYFDLPAGNYTIGVTDALGRTAETGKTSSINGGLSFKSQWDVTVTAAKPTTDVDFLLNSTSTGAQGVTVKGTVYADLNGDGQKQGIEGGASGFTVFADLNHTGLLEPGEPTDVTDSNGQYTLQIPTNTPNTFSIDVLPQQGWTATAPTIALGKASPVLPAYGSPGDTVTGVDFGFKPPSSPIGQGPGKIYGYVFNDFNGDGVQQPAFEGGLQNITVYIDANNNGVFDGGDTQTTTDAAGAYHFDDVPIPASGIVHVRISLPTDSNFVITAPMSGVRDIPFAAGQVSQGAIFGVRNTATDDYGDLQAAGFLTYGANAPHNLVVPGFSLGTQIDAETRSSAFDINGNPIAGLDGVGDDQVGLVDDEDGVSIVGGAIRPNFDTLTIVTQGIGGYLNGWIDFNNNGTFDSGEQVITNMPLNPGSHQITITAPSTLTSSTVAARFRWGDLGQSWSGANPNAGEVEDYVFNSTTTPLKPGDYNGDQAVDSLDYNLWKSTFGSTTNLIADGDHNGVVDTGDYVIWADHKTSPGAGSAAMLQADVATAPYSTAALDPSAVLAQAIAVQNWRNAAFNTPTPDFLAWLQLVGGHSVTVNGPNGPQIQYVVGGPAAAPPAGSGGASTVADSVASSTIPSAVSQQVGLPFVLNASQPTKLAMFTAATNVSNSSSNANLLLLDLAIADFGGPSGSQSDDSLLSVPDDGQPQTQEQLSDLALAAAFDNETDWRNAI
jgi:hypothetical protein